MAKETNPFVVTGKIESQFFCDRVVESKRLIKTLSNGRNMVIISPRRMGKTGLIQFCYDKPEIRDNYYTFFIDILHTSGLREFTYVLGKEIFDTLAPRSKKMLNLFIRTLKSISGKFGFDPFTNAPVFNLELGDIDRPEYTIEEIFKYLASADRPCIVAIDEFQQISKYPEKSIEAFLRTHIQKIENSNFIFAGSERGMMQAMFLSSSRPFYQSSDLMEIGAIDKDIYVPFVIEIFERYERRISSENVMKVYDLFKGHTFYIQKTFNECFADTSPGEECTIETILTAIESMISESAIIYREILSKIPEKQKELLYAIAKEKEVKQILSGSFIRRHNLASASSVQAALKKLIEKELVAETNKSYYIVDKLFALWINEIYGDSISGYFNKLS